MMVFVAEEQCRESILPSFPVLWIWESGLGLFCRITVIAMIIGKVNAILKITLKKKLGGVEEGLLSEL